ncbi:biotin/lipoyl-containing protein [Actinomadura parmotrematis]|uniref:Lipoyl-binding domain-containing protein n=1 Tax=Actinomadura parmotrematis TaxID=2864039 RepID=A0ABS7FVB8_9ACTN|nr:biotin/lipoyl-containing protein [Actinomadura parmotrematis]MBW8484370.1 hypothetical protein [Actinomadura parmotrematis]
MTEGGTDVDAMVAPWRRARGGGVVVTAPDFGTGEPGTVRRWLASPGEPVDAGEPLLVVSDGLREIVLTAPAAGVLRGPVRPGRLRDAGVDLCSIQNEWRPRVARVPRHERYIRHERRVRPADPVAPPEAAPRRSTASVVRERVLVGLVVSWLVSPLTITLAHRLGPDWLAAAVAVGTLMTIPLLLLWPPDG